MQTSVLKNVRSYFVQLIQVVLKFFSFSKHSNCSTEDRLAALVQQLNQVSEEKENIQSAFETAKRDWETEKEELLASINFLEGDKLRNDNGETENEETDEVEFLGQFDNFQVKNTVDLVELESISPISNFENGIDDVYKALKNETSRMREMENIRQRPNPTPNENQQKLLRQIVYCYAKYLQKSGISQENLQIFSLNLMHSNTFWKKCINAVYNGKMREPRVKSYVAALLKLVKDKERSVVLDALRSVGCSDELLAIFVKLADEFELRKADPEKITFKEFVRPV